MQFAIEGFEFDLVFVEKAFKAVGEAYGTAFVRWWRRLSDSMFIDFLDLTLVLNQGQEFCLKLFGQLLGLVGSAAACDHRLPFSEVGIVLGRLL